MRRIYLVMCGAALLAALVAAIRRALSKEGALARPLIASDSEVIERPQEEVFAYVSDLQNIPEWGALSGEMRKETEGPPEVGTRFSMAIEMQPDGFFRVIGPLLEKMTQRYYFRKELKTLKGLLESRG